MPASGTAGAAVLPVLDDQVVLLHHARQASRTSHLEIPRGFGEPGVSAADQARQELLEEINADIVNLVDLGSFHANTGMASDVTQLFVAEIRELGKPQAAEGITGVKVYPARQVAGLIKTGQITDSFTIAAFTRAWLFGRLPGLPGVDL